MNNQILNPIANNSTESFENVWINTSYEDLFQSFLFTADGKRSQDEWLAQSLIDVLVELRIMTASQLIRWIVRQDKIKTDEQITAFISELFRHNLIGKMVVSIPVIQSKRIREGENEMQKTTIIFLNENCRPLISSADQKFARFGPPQNVNFDRIYHDLLVAESIITVSEGYIIAPLKSEDKIRSEMQKRVKDFSGSLPDFKICVYKNNGKGIPASLGFVAGEVIVQLKGKNILGKPEHILFFTANIRVADTIKYIRKTNPILLGDVAFPSESEVIINHAYDMIFDPAAALLRNKIAQLHKNNLYDNPECWAIIQHLSRQGPLTETALSTLTRLNRDNISKKLKKLIDKKLVHSEDVQLAPGVQVGRPHRLFAFSEIDLSNYDFRLKQLLLSNSICKNPS